VKNIRIKRHDKLNIRIDVWQDEYIDNKGKVISARWKLYAYCGNSTRSVAREAISALISSENIDATGKGIIAELKRLESAEIDLLERMRVMIDERGHL